MLLFLRNIPANTRIVEIHKFIKPAMGRGLVTSINKGRIISVKIVGIQDLDTTLIEYHGLVKIEPDTVAQKVIKKLNRKPFKGVRINVREYRTRSWHNDRRNGMASNQNLNNKRFRDRRRRNIEILDDYTNQFSSSSNFHRVL